MIDSFVTRCPHCRTSFRVSRAQLTAAHGAVRCGACLEVFSAAQHLLSADTDNTLDAPTVTLPPLTAPLADSAPVLPVASATQATPPGKTPSDTLWIHDDLDLDNLDLDEEMAKLEQQEQQFSQEFLALDQAPRGAETFLRPEPQVTDRLDERWVEALLHDSTTAPSPAAPSAHYEPAIPLRLVAHSPSTFTPDEPEPAAIVVPIVPPITADPDEAVDLGRSFNARNRPLAPLSLEPDDEPSDYAAQSSAQPEPEAELEPEPEPEPDFEPIQAKRPTERRKTQRREDVLVDMDDEPLQLDWQAPSTPWGRRLGWALLNLLAAAALGGQYLWYHFDELARQDQYRPWFEQLCPVLGCTLPAKVEISLIKSSNLVVRSHPQFSGALVVDAILYNRAPFAQPFPVLEMRFADLNGQLLASRRFTPNEYLAGELAGQMEMPQQTPIHISLDILDPGPQAVNYSLNFLSPQ